MRHAIRIAIIWAVISIIVEILIGILPIPAPTGSTEGVGEHQTIYMLCYLGAPIFVFIWVMLVYCLVTFRAHAGEAEVDRPPLPESGSILFMWAGISFIIVLFLAGWGSFTLHEITAAPAPAIAQGQHKGTRHTPNTGQQGSTVSSGPTRPNVKPLDVQVIGQQWLWTFRYPSYGGMETRDLVIPVHTPILFHVTSLDVVHSFWLFQYDVKEDAVPGVDNTAWMLARYTGTSLQDDKEAVKCNELCGIWHGYMRADVYVTTKSAFKSWASRQLKYERTTGVLKNLPAYSLVYYPTSNANFPPAPQDQSP